METRHEGASARLRFLLRGSSLMSMANSVPDLALDVSTGFAYYSAYSRTPATDTDRPRSWLDPPVKWGHAIGSWVPAAG
jgi:hypothetical protein